MGLSLKPSPSGFSILGGLMLRAGRLFSKGASPCSGRRRAGLFSKSPVGLSLFGNPVVRGGRLFSKGESPPSGRRRNAFSFSPPSGFSLLAKPVVRGGRFFSNAESPPSAERRAGLFSKSPAGLSLFGNPVVRGGRLFSKGASPVSERRRAAFPPKLPRSTDGFSFFRMGFSSLVFSEKRPSSSRLRGVGGRFSLPSGGVVRFGSFFLNLEKGSSFFFFEKSGLSEDLRPPRLGAAAGFPEFFAAPELRFGWRLSIVL